MHKVSRMAIVFAMTFLLAGMAFASANPDYDKAQAQAAKLAENLQSYQIESQLVMQQKPVGAPEGMKFEAVQKSSARMPDRLNVSIESPMFVQTWGTGASSSWFYFAQQQVCYVGQPAMLQRTLEEAESMGLEEDQVYNFYAGIGENLLTNTVDVDAETGSETLTIGTKEVPCQVFTFNVLDDDGQTNRGHGSYWFDTKSGLVLKSSITTLSEMNGQPVEGNMTSIVTSFALNKDVPEEIFAYTPPADAKLVNSFEKLMNPDSMVGETADDITFTTFDGNAVNLKDYRGKVVFLDFWATWCGPCRMEMPHIESLYKELKDAGEVVFIGASNEPQQTIEGWLEKNPYSFKIMMVKPEDAQGKFKVTSIPAGFVIDRQGVIRAHMIGAQSEEQLRAAIEKGLAH